MVTLNGIDKDLNYLEEASFHIKIPDNISNFVNLRILRISGLDDKLELTESFLEDLINLEELRLWDVFDSMDSNVLYLFKDLVKLKQLKMNLNKINILKSTYFEYLLNLEVLDLERNEIKSIEQSPFNNLSKLWNLDLSNNPIEIINKTNLDGLFELKYLYLRKNTTEVELMKTKLTKDAIQRCTNLRKLYYL